MTRVLTVLLLAVLTGCAGTTPPAVPAPAPGPLPLARSEVAGTRWGDALVVAGGYLRDGATSARVDRWSPEQGWTRLADLPAPRNHPGLAVLGDRLWLVAGHDETDTATTTVWSLGEGEPTWRTEAPLAVARNAAVVVAVGDRLVVTGGAAGAVALTSTEVLSGGAWEPGPDLTTAREHLAGAVAGGRVYAIAGRVGGLDGNLAVVESWAPGEPAWRAEPALRAPRGGTSADTVDGAVCVAGGEDTVGTEAVVECLRGGAWVVAGRLAQPRHGLAVVALEDGLHVVGGGPEPGLTVSTAHEVLDVRGRQDP